MLIDILKERSTQCELCSSSEDLSAYIIPPKTQETAENSALLCGACQDQLQSDSLDINHWFCLNESAWTQEPPVQVLVYRLLSRLNDQDWAQELKDQIYLEDSVREYAEEGLGDEGVTVVDSNGTPLQEGDTVSLIRSLDVKGAGFTAKQGTIVRNIRLGDDPTHIEGKVNGTSIMLKTIFLKKN